MPSYNSKLLSDHPFLVANFAAYLFAPPILVTPLGALSVLIGCVCRIVPQPVVLLHSLSAVFYRAVLASLFLKEELGHIGRVGCTLCFIGSLIIVLHAPPDKDIQTVDEMLHYAIQPGASPTDNSPHVR